MRELGKHGKGLEAASIERLEKHDEESSVEEMEQCVRGMLEEMGEVVEGRESVGRRRCMA